MTALSPGTRLFDSAELASAFTNTAAITAAVAAEATARDAAITAAQLASTIRSEVPLTGDTITLTAGQRLLFVNPAGTIATLTVKLPPTPVAGQIVEMSFSQIVTALTVQDSAAGAVASTAGAVGVAIQYRYIGSAWTLWT